MLEISVFYGINGVVLVVPPLLLREGLKRGTPHLELDLTIVV